MPNQTINPKILGNPFGGSNTAADQQPPTSTPPAPADPGVLSSLYHAIMGPSDIAPGHMNVQAGQDSVTSPTPAIQPNISTQHNQLGGGPIEPSPGEPRAIVHRPSGPISPGAVIDTPPQVGIADKFKALFQGVNPYTGKPR